MDTGRCQCEKRQKIGDLFITATGDTSVIRGEHIELMKDGAILANTGHFNVEINTNDLEEMAVAKKRGKKRMWLNIG